VEEALELVLYHDLRKYNRDCSHGLGASSTKRIATSLIISIMALFEVVSLKVISQTILTSVNPSILQVVYCTQQPELKRAAITTKPKL